LALWNMGIPDDRKVFPDFAGFDAESPLCVGKIGTLQIGAGKEPHSTNQARSGRVGIIASEVAFIQAWHGCRYVYPADPSHEVASMRAGRKIAVGRKNALYPPFNVSCTQADVDRFRVLAA
jgi:hypothetical protein